MSRKPTVPLTEAERSLVEENLNLARAYAPTSPWVRFARLETDDAVQAAALGLCRAAQRYDPANTKFSTYSRYWMWAAIQNDGGRRRMATGRPGKSVFTRQTANDGDMEALVPDPHGAAAPADGVSGRLLGLLSTLTGRERRCVELRYGLLGGVPLNLREVGETVGVSAERVRQIVNCALNKMRVAAGDENDWL